MRNRDRWPLLVVLALVATLVSGSVRGQSEPGRTAVETPEIVTPTAAVAIDGRTLFQVRGFSSLPADQRAAAIADRIERIARNPSIPASAVEVADVEGSLQIRAGANFVMSVFDSDGVLEGVSKTVLANGHAERVSEAITMYRQARTRQSLTRMVLFAAGAIGAFFAASWLLTSLTRKLSALLESRYKKRLRNVGVQSFEILRADRVWEALTRLLNLLGTLAIVVLAMLTLDGVLGLFPWTRPVANQLTGNVARPVGLLFRALLSAIPDLLFLIVLFFVVKYFLRFTRLFFDAMERGAVSFSGFESEWAQPTFRLVRILTIAFAIVVAYPYIPGSSSDAFKGVSLFLGIIFSLGSSSFIANAIAGYSMTYRRAFRVGDRVRIGDVVGDVTAVRMQATHIKTPKNEEVTVPNSQILAANVVNYSRLASEDGLLLHATVGIGYETPWRQVEAMLLLAAERTAGLMKEPRPFVHLTALGDFCVTYEVNVSCATAQQMPDLYAELHRQILDVFNEYGVQIMTPAYEGDAEKPKVVPKDQWYLAPAKKPDPKGSAVDT